MVVVVDPRHLLLLRGHEGGGGGGGGGGGRVPVQVARAQRLQQLLLLVWRLACPHPAPTPAPDHP